MQIVEERVAKDPSTSYWLKEQIASSSDRDPVDALRDAEILVNILRQRVDGMPIIIDAE